MFGSRVLNDRLRSNVLLTLKSGASFQGVLWAADRQAFVLRNVVAVESSTNPSPSVTAVDGELVVLVDDVEFMQIP